MIVHYNVCDQCGNQTQIYIKEEGKENKGFQICFSIVDLIEALQDKKFGIKYRSATFCDKECMLEFLKANISDNGQLKMDDDE